MKGGTLVLIALIVMALCTLCGRGFFEVTVPDKPVVTAPVKPKELE